MRVSALIPVKGFRNAKQRLSPLLDADGRENFAEAMFRDVLKQIVKARGVEQAFVVTGDAKVSKISESLGAQVLWEQAENGETEAVHFARKELQQAGYEAALIIPGDMPLVRSEDIEQVLSHVPQNATAPFALLVPAHDRMGTNALLLAPPDIIKLRFGYDSFNYHLSQMSKRGLPLRYVENERMALDIDEPKDLERFLTWAGEESDSYRLARAMVADVDADQLGSSAER